MEAPYGVPVRKGTAGSGILTVRLRHKADAVHFIQQGVRVVGQFVLQLVPVEGEHLVEVDLLAARQPPAPLHRPQTSHYTSG